MQRGKKVAPALTVLAIASIAGALTTPSLAVLFWVLAALFSVGAALVAFQNQPDTTRPRSFISSIVFTLVGLGLGILLLNLLD